MVIYVNDYHVIPTIFPDKTSDGLSISDYISQDLLETVFKDGVVLKTYSLSEVRQRVLENV